MDAIDRKILAVLQCEGRLTLTELAERVQLSVSPCHRRLRALERDGTIQGYRAVVDPAALGLTFEALVFVTMRQEDRDTLLGFEKAVIPRSNLPKGKIAGLEIVAVERVDQAVQLLRNL